MLLASEAVSSLVRSSEAEPAPELFMKERSSSMSSSTLKASSSSSQSFLREEEPAAAALFLPPSSALLPKRVVLDFLAVVVDVDVVVVVVVAAAAAAVNGVAVPRGGDGFVSFAASEKNERRRAAVQYECKKSGLLNISFVSCIFKEKQSKSASLIRRGNI